MTFSLNINKVLSSITLLAVLAIPGVGYSVTMIQGKPHGRVGMQGSIIDGACAIDTGSQKQIIDIDLTSVDSLSRDNEGHKIDFHINLKNCSIDPANPSQPDWSAFRVTFDGQRGENGSFKTDGDAKGFGIKIFDSEGASILPGIPTGAHEISLGKMQLDYALKLVSNHEILQPGEYQTTIRFKLDYY
jgi:type 1 fimbria pilin